MAVLDALPAHFDPDHAPRDILSLLAAWLGVDLDESQEIRHQREMVRRAADLGRKRGTVAGMELALKLAYPDVPLRIEDQGGVRWSLDQHPVDAPPPSFVVYCDKPVAEEVQAGIARCIEQHKPVGTSYRLRVKAPKKKDDVMRTCQSCGLQNPPDRDFCECGEYLRWEPTGYVQAITPEMAAQAAAEAAAPAQRAQRRRRRRPPPAAPRRRPPPRRTAGPSPSSPSAPPSRPRPPMAPETGMAAV